MNPRTKTIMTLAHCFQKGCNSAVITIGITNMSGLVIVAMPVIVGTAWFSSTDSETVCAMPKHAYTVAISNQIGETSNSMVYE
jgi:hypothetical protein